MGELEKRERYVIPHNYKERGGILGLFDTRRLAEGAIAAGGVASLLLPFLITAKISGVVKVIVLAAPCMVVLALGIAGLHGEPWSRVLVYLVKYIQSKRKLSYRLEVTETEEQANGRNRKKRHKGE